MAAHEIIWQVSLVDQKLFAADLQFDSSKQFGSALQLVQDAMMVAVVAVVVVLVVVAVMQLETRIRRGTGKVIVLYVRSTWPVALFAVFVSLALVLQSN